MATQLAREVGAHVIGTGRATAVRRRSTSAPTSSSTSRTTPWKSWRALIWCSIVLGGDIRSGREPDPNRRNAGDRHRAAEARPGDGLAIDFVVVSDRAQLSEIARRVRDGRLRTNIGKIATLDGAVAAFNPTERIKGKTSSAFVREDSGPRTVVLVVRTKGSVC